MCFFLLPCIPSRATTCKPIDCTTIKGKLTATRKPCQATVLGGESLLSSESSKSLISDVFLLYSVPKAFRSFLFVCYSYTRLIKRRASRSSIFFSHTPTHIHILSTNLSKRQLSFRIVQSEETSYLCPACASDLVLASSMICVHTLRYIYFLCFISSRCKLRLKFQRVSLRVLVHKVFSP